MNKRWHVLFCDNKNCCCPVSQFIETCSTAHQVKILRFLNLLEESGPTLPRPYADILEDGIHELRLRLSGDQFRILYFFCYEDFIILYQAFHKTTDRIPEKYISETRQYREDFIRKFKRAELEKYRYADTR